MGRPGMGSTYLLSKELAGGAVGTERLSGGPSLQPELTRGDTSTEVSPPVAAGVRGPKMLDARRPGSAIRSQTDNYPNEWKGQSASSGVNQAEVREDCWRTAPRAGQAEQPTTVLSVCPFRNQRWMARRLGM